MCTISSLKTQASHNYIQFRNKRSKTLNSQIVPIVPDSFETSHNERRNSKNFFSRLSMPKWLRTIPSSVQFRKKNTEKQLSIVRVALLFTVCVCGQHVPTKCSPGVFFVDFSGKSRHCYTSFWRNWDTRWELLFFSSPDDGQFVQVSGFPDTVVCPCSFGRILSFRSAFVGNKKQKESGVAHFSEQLGNVQSCLDLMKPRSL